MSYTVNDLLASNRFPGMQLLCVGGVRLDREIRGIRILHTPDMARFMQGGEVLLTSLQAYENAEEKEVRQHLQEICDKKVCAL